MKTDGEMSSSEQPGCQSRSETLTPAAQSWEVKTTKLFEPCREQQVPVAPGASAHARAGGTHRCCAV